MIASRRIMKEVVKSDYCSVIFIGLASNVGGRSLMDGKMDDGLIQKNFSRPVSTGEETGLYPYDGKGIYTLQRRIILNFDFMAGAEIETSSLKVLKGYM